MLNINLSSIPNNQASTLFGMPSTIAERLNEALKDAAKKPADLARACSISAAAVSEWLSGQTKGLKPANLSAAAQFLGVQTDWLATGEGAKSRNMIGEPEAIYSPERYVFANKVVGAIIQSGNGGITWEHEEVDQTHAFQRTWIEKEGLDIKRCKIFKNHGNSNAPWIMEGDAVLVHLGDRRITNSEDPTDNVFAVQYGEHSKFKRLMPQHDGSILLRSFNPDKSLYPDERVAGDELESLAIIGRVAWRGG